ncbi:MAG: single-stranded-DNA-specific exonuclease RecJ [Sedimentisphaerales bacterium]|nr:single-stranded-DNA-specific exonuclease RecJ [Sedimentisphaerales bacterium]MBN2844263.1 single-stranded-DNA-specific exonuclease RecJ [Sedimentisphaerales bacterium]
MAKKKIQSETIWKIAPQWPGRESLAAAVGVAPFIAQLLYNRGISDLDTARDYLAPKLNALHEPELMAGIAPAIARIRQALEQNEKIVIYGDYDVDGTTGTAILWHCFKLTGREVEFYTPHRIDEGYGLHSEAVRQLAEDGCQLLITVDCAITAVEQVALANSLGIDVIITDHHTPPAELPQACAIVHPNLPGGNYPNHSLCGSGVAYKLAWALAKTFSGGSKVKPEFREFLLSATSLAALGTIGDVMPLLGENRVLVSWGINALLNSTNPGIRALMEKSGCKDNLTSRDVAFMLAPRLNAAGRLGHARLAIELFTTASEAKAGQIAEYLDQQNKERQKIEKKIVDDACTRINAAGWHKDEWKVLIIEDENWHPGVIGIVAGRLLEKYNKPTIVLSAHENGMYHGSARSPENFNIHQALDTCKEYLVSFGGHARAAGVKIEPERLNDFRAAMNNYVKEHGDSETGSVVINIDTETTLPELTRAAVADLGRLEPVGEGNPGVMLALRGLEIIGEPKKMGKAGEHLALLVREPGKPELAMRAVAFKMGDLEKTLIDARSVDIAFAPKLNHFNGNTTVEMLVKDIKTNC